LTFRILSSFGTLMALTSDFLASPLSDIDRLRAPSGTSGCRFRFLLDRNYQGVAEMIRDLFIALLIMIVAVTATVWVNSGPKLTVQQVEASLAN
jgi:hypothetical protein